MVIDPAAMPASKVIDRFLAADLDLTRPFTSTMADKAGVTRRDRALLITEGLLARPLQGVLHVAHLPDLLELRLACLELVLPEDAVVTDRTAAWLHGAVGALEPGAHVLPPRVSAFQAPGKRLRNELAASGERRLIGRDVVRVGKLQVTTHLRTACDVGRLLHRDGALAAMDAIASLGVVTHDEIMEEGDRFKGYRGVRQLRALAPLVDPGSESFGESALRLRWYDACISERPETQVVVWSHDGVEARLDLGSREHRFAAEYDGERFHGPDAEEHDRIRRAWLADEGWTVVVCRRENVFGRHQDAVRALRAGFAQARLRRRT